MANKELIKYAVTQPN